MSTVVKTLRRWARRPETGRLVRSRAGIARRLLSWFDSQQLTINEIAALNNLAQEITAQLDPETLLKLIIRRAVELLNGVTGGIYLLDANHEYLTVVSDFGGHKSIVGHTLRMGEGMAGRVAQTRRPLRVADYKVCPYRSDKLDPNFFGAVVEVPLATRDKEGILGVLYVSDYGKGTFGSRHEKVLALFASQAAIAINNAQNISLLELLSNVSSRISSAITLHDILQQTLRESLRAVGTDEGSIMVLDPRTKKLEIKAWIVENEFVADKSHRQFDLDEGIAGHVAVTKKEYICSDSHKDPHFVQSASGRNPRSILCVPIICNETLLCIINADNQKPHFFQMRHIELLSRLATHVAMAIESQRLRDFSSSLTTLSPATDLYARIVESAFHLTNAEMSSLFVQREGVRGVERAAVFPQSLEHLDPDIRRGGLTAEILKDPERRPIRINDAQNDPRVKKALKDRGVKALMGAPLYVRLGREGEEKSKALGALFVSTTLSRQFTDRDEEILQSLANQAAVAVANAGLYSYQQSLSNGAFDAIIAIDRMGIIKEFNRSARLVLGYEKDDDINSFVSHAKQLFANQGELGKITRLLLKKGNEGRLINHYTDLKTKSGELVSIRLSASLLENGIVGFFRDQRQIESANQYIQQIHGLLETGKVIAEAADLEAALNATVKEAGAQLKASPVCLYYYDQELDQILLPPIREGLLDKNAVSADAGEDSVVRQVIRDGEIFTSDTPQHPVLAGEFVAREKIRATAACPLLHSKQNKIVGVLFCNYREPHTFTEQDKAFIRLFATDAANAIDNAHSFQQASRKAKQLNALSRAVKGLATNLTLTASLQSVLERARDITDAELGALGVMKEEHTFEPFLASGMDPHLKKLVGAPPSAHGLFGKLFHSPGEIMLQNVAHQSNPSELPAHHPPITSFLGVPITFKETRIGNLYVANKKNAAEFDDEDAIGLKLLAALAALCIKSAESAEDKGTENFEVAYLLFSRFAGNLRETGIQISAELNKLRRGLLGTIYEESLKKISRVLSDLNSPGYQVTLDHSESNRILSFSMLLDLVVHRLNLDESAVRLVRGVESARFVSGNQLFLEFALSIVLENAVEAILRTERPGMLKLDCFARGGLIHTEITDTGDGIPPEILTDLFKRPVKGKNRVGIASAAVASIVNAHKGEVRVMRTAVNEGTTISISLPEVKR